MDDINNDWYKSKLTHTFHHIVKTFDEDGSLKIYFDGNLISISNLSLIDRKMLAVE